MSTNRCCALSPLGVLNNEVPPPGFHWIEEAGGVRFYLSDGEKTVGILATHAALVYVADGQLPRDGFMRRFGDYRQTFEAFANPQICPRAT